MGGEIVLLQVIQAGKNDAVNNVAALEVEGGWGTTLSLKSKSASCCKGTCRRGATGVVVQIACKWRIGIGLGRTGFPSVVNQLYKQVLQARGCLRCSAVFVGMIKLGRKRKTNEKSLLLFM